jgi:hypothetical protein
VSARFPFPAAILAALALAPGSASSQADTVLRLDTGTGFQTTEGGLSRFEYGQISVPPAYDVIRSRAAVPQGALAVQPLAKLTGNVGNLSWDVGFAAMPLSNGENRDPDAPTAAYQGRLGVGYDWGAVSLFGVGSVVPSPARGIGSASYVEGGASMTAPLSLVFGARVGYQWLDSAAMRGETAETVDWSLGVSREMFGFTFSLQYGGTEPANARSRASCDSTTTTCDQRLYFSIDRRF